MMREGATGGKARVHWARAGLAYLLLQSRRAEYKQVLDHLLPLPHVVVRKKRANGPVDHELRFHDVEKSFEVLLALGLAEGAFLWDTSGYTGSGHLVHPSKIGIERVRARVLWHSKGVRACARYARPRRAL